MVAISKYIVVCLLSTVAFIACAEQTKSPDQIYKEDQVINFAYNMMKKAIELLDGKIDECTKLAKETRLDPSLFESIELTTDELRAVLRRFLFQSIKKCEGGDLWGKATEAFARFKFIEKKYKGKNIIETETTFEQICCGNVAIDINAELEYLKIAPEIRKKLENIPELQQPFNVFRVLEALKL